MGLRHRKPRSASLPPSATTRIRMSASRMPSSRCRPPAVVSPLTLAFRISTFVCLRRKFPLNHDGMTSSLSRPRPAVRLSPKEDLEVLRAVVPVCAAAICSAVGSTLPLIGARGGVANRTGGDAGQRHRQRDGSNGAGHLVCFYCALICSSSARIAASSIARSRDAGRAPIRQRPGSSQLERRPRAADVAPRPPSRHPRRLDPQRPDPLAVIRPPCSPSREPLE